MPEIRLKLGRERSVLRQHPWIFSGAIADVKGEPGAGETVEIYGHSGDWLARAAYSPESQIRARIWTWRPEERVDELFLEKRLKSAIQARSELAEDDSLDAYREVYAESDGLPGIIVDRYGSFRVVQFLTAGAERWRAAVIGCLSRAGDCEGIIERSDVEVRGLEGLAQRSGVVWGSCPPVPLRIQENGVRYFVDLLRGQKTGFYLDQRDNRQMVRQRMTGGEVLDCFSYTGGFTISALLGGADRVLSIDRSSLALDLGRRNLGLNSLDPRRCQWVKGNVFEELRRLRDASRSFQVVILDPPRFAATGSQADRASRGYKDINLLAFKLLQPGGRLFTYSCSGGVSPELFRKVVAAAAMDAGVGAQIISWAGQPADHPVALNFPESRYLKGLVCRVI